MASSGRALLFVTYIKILSRQTYFRYEDESLLGYIIRVTSITLMIEAVRASETSV
jgi:hypothetical protein